MIYPLHYIIFVSENKLQLSNYKCFTVSLYAILKGTGGVNMNYCSNPTDLKITDMRFVDIDGTPKRCTILRIDTNQGS